MTKNIKGPFALFLVIHFKNIVISSFITFLMVRLHPNTMSSYRCYTLRQVLER